MARIVLDGVTKVFGSDVVAVNDMSLEIGDGEFMVLVGPSGCGKSTILRILAGLEEVTAGEVFIDDRQVTDLPPKDRDVAMVFQNYALYPHMSVEQNLGFGLKLRKMSREEIRTRVADAAKTLGLEPLMNRFLMDEPLSNLDAKLRVQMRAELARLHDRLETTTVYVTHDQVEAMTLGERVAVLREGVLQQVDTPQNLYNRPTNLFVAAFIGSPPMNLVEAKVAAGAVSFGGFELPVAEETDIKAYEGRVLILGIRPSDLEDADVWQSGDLPTIEATADVTEELGSEVNVLFAVDAPPVTAEAAMVAITEESAEETPLPLIAGRGQSVFCARVDARTKCRPGARIRLSVDPRRFHFFDPETGLAVGTTAPAVATA
ncbi:MAG: ATP-binding cassette domain-containing protein [Actinobacteria bacterium]|nr:ATP-binding cassette domain-containing protein [Actinomycetota bacterium]